MVNSNKEQCSKKLPITLHIKNTQGKSRHQRPSQQHRQQLTNYQSIFNNKNHLFSSHSKNRINHGTKNDGNMQIIQESFSYGSPNSHYLSSHSSHMNGVGGKDCPWQIKAPTHFQVNVSIIKLIVSNSKADKSSQINNKDATSFDHYDHHHLREDCIELFTLREVDLTRYYSSCDVLHLPSHIHTSSSNFLEVEMSHNQQTVYLLKFQGTKQFAHIYKFF